MPEAQTPFGPLAYLYVGSRDFPADCALYRDVLGAREVWSFAKFGARVAAFTVGEGPMVLIADHRPAPSVLPIYAVDDLDATERQLRARGFRPEGERFEVPDSPVLKFRDPSGNEWAILQIVRPHALEHVEKA